MKKKTVLITVSIILLLSTLAWALWPAIILRAGIRVGTAAGGRRVVASAALSQTAARGAARLAVVNNKPDLAWKVSSSAAALLGIGYLLADTRGLRDEALQNPAMVTETGETVFSIDNHPDWPHGSLSGGRFHGYAWNGPRYYVINVIIEPNSITFQGADQRYDDGLLEFYEAECTQVVNGVATKGRVFPLAPDYTVNVINQQAVPYASSPVIEVNLGALDAWIDAHPELWQDQAKVATELSPTMPEGATDMGETTDVTVVDDTAPDQQTGKVTDPETGQDQTPLEDPEDSYSPSPQPAKPIFDTAMDIPEKLSIPDKITDFINNAPFMNVINNFEVNATAGSSSLTFQVYGKSITWDFSRYEYYYNLMAALLLSLAYIWSAQIVFGGRA